MNKKKGTVSSLRSIVLFFKEEKFKITFGSFLVLLSIYMILAFISYFFNWQADQDFSWAKVFSGPDIIVENHAGKIGAWMSSLMLNRWFGIASFSIPIYLAIYGLKLLGMEIQSMGKIFINLSIVTILLSVFLSFIFPAKVSFLGSGPGGAHGFYLNQWLRASLGIAGTAFLLIILILAYFLYSFKNSLKLLSFNKKDLPKQEPEMEVAPSDEISPEPEILKTEAKEEIDISVDIPEEIPEENQDEVQLIVEQRPEEETSNNTIIQADYDPTLDLSSYKYPSLKLLRDHETGNSTVSNDELIKNKNKIIDTLAHYKITIDKIKATIGPTVTLYEIVPAPGIRISKIKNLEDDIALSLAALGIRIIAPIPGKGTIGIEVPNLQPRIVGMKNVLSSKRFQECNYELPIALGKTISNETYVVDLAKMPHLLVAGATGQGKSVGLNAIIASLLFKKHPAQLKFVLVDPKKVELTLFTKIERHFLAKLPDTEEAIITDTQKVITTLKSLTQEMDQRYDLMQLAQVRDIKEYNHKFIKRNLNPEKGHRYFPYIVLVIDEFADLIMTAGREIVDPLARLAQLARAIGIHLIIATQRPTTNIITGSIKANFPARLAFRVISVIDSRTILDMSGANQLIGKGDMLISTGSDVTRLQCAFIDTPEVEELTEYIGSQRGYSQAHLLPEVDEVQSEAAVVDLQKKDPKFEEAARLVIQTQQGSTSMIQRKLALGYNRAGRIVDQLEAAGILGPFEGSKARAVLIQDELSLEHILKGLE
ncbi:MAG: DNA translocase FtsK [Bacteroidales bacterium]|nr:DNA translocase FtsK [Bacteroidales bacterium]